MNRKWDEFHKAHQEQSKESQRAYVEYFKEHLVAHLSKAPDPDGETNQPSKIIQDAKGAIGALSRIFDAFDFPVPTYQEIQAISQKPNGLRKHMQENLNELLPFLLNKDRTALSQEVRDAIGEKNYNEMRNTEQEIAMQFVKAIVTSYGQRMLDKFTKSELHKTEDPEQIEQNEKLATNFFAEIMTPMGDLANKVTLMGLPEKTKQMNSSELQEIINTFKGLLLEAKTAQIPIPKINIIIGNLETASGWMDTTNEECSMMPEALRISKAIGEYDKAVNLFVNEAEKVLSSGLRNQLKSVGLKNFYAQFLITRNCFKMLMRSVLIANRNYCLESVN